MTKYMDILDLYKFIHDENSFGVEAHKTKTENGYNCFLLIDFDRLNDFTKMVGNYICESGIEVTMMEKYIAIDINDLCDDFDIDIERLDIDE
jgi:hypothetical protein